MSGTLQRREGGGGLGAKTGDHCRPNVLMETNSAYVNAKCASQQPMYVCTSLVRSPYFHSNFRSEGEIGPGDIRGSKPSTYTAENGAAPIRLGLSTRLHTYIHALIYSKELKTYLWIDHHQDAT